MKEEQKKSYKNVNLRTKKDFSYKEDSTQKDKLLKKTKRTSSIPKVVANRMARRIAFTSGLPTILGMSVFVVSYLLITKGIAEVPPSITLTISAICFLIGLLGLSYGILSASWDDNPGSILGLENVRPNITKMRSAFQPKNEKKG